MEAHNTILKRDSYRLDGFMGGSVALAGASETFYATRNCINFIGVQYKKVVEVSDYKKPVQATPARNPNAKHACMEVAVTFF